MFRTFKDFIVQENNNIIFSKVYDVILKYDNSREENIKAKISIGKDGENFKLLLDFNGKHYEKKLKLLTEYTYKIMKSMIHIGHIEDFIRTLEDSLIYRSFIKKLIIETTGFKYDPYGIGSNIFVK